MDQQQTQAAAVTVACLVSVALFSWWRYGSDKTMLLHELEGKLDAAEKQRKQERAGRVSAERELREMYQQKLQTNDGIFVQPIATIRSCFKNCLGTPRQGFLAPQTRATLQFTKNVSPEAFDSLEQFSHIWIIFVFHLNTNGKSARAHSNLQIANATRSLRK